MNGDANQMETLAAVGRALTVWEAMEDNLATMCVIFSGLSEDAKGNYAFRRLFGSIDLSGVRRNALNNMAEIYFGQSEDGKAMTRRLNALMNAISNASRRRDDIAHGTVVAFAGNRPVGSFLLPAGYNSERNKAFLDRPVEIDPDFPFHTLTAEYRYTSKDIANIIAKFYTLLQSVMTYLGEFAAWKEKE